MNNLRLLVVGGTGFFGKSIIDSFLRGLLKKYRIKWLIISSRSASNFQKQHPEFVHKNIKFIDLDITNAKTIPESDIIIHAATSAKQINYIKDPFYEKENTERGIINFIDLIKKLQYKPKIVYCSSGAVYGIQPSNILNIREDFPFQDIQKLSLPKKIYCLSKREAEKIILESGKENLNVSIARCFAFYGKYLPIDEHFAYGNFLRDAKKGKDIVVNADHLVFRSYMHSDELVNSLIKIAFSSNSTCPIYNVGSDNEISLFDLAKKIAKKYNVKVKMKKNINYQKIDRYVPNTDKLKTLISLN